ncbi:MAG: hypothetical protein RLZZ293_1363 [Pseudomonadota bacterium]|jgi:hypothetical protein
MVMIPQGNNRTTITEPIYVESGFVASAIQFNSAIFLDDQQAGRLNIRTGYPLQTPQLSFSLTRADDAPFWVDTNNYSGPYIALESEETTRYLSNNQITLDNEVIQPFMPLQQHSFVQANGTFVYQNTHSITVATTIFDSKAPWYIYTDDAVKPYFYTMSYNMMATPYYGTNITHNYNGFGFWVCGNSQTQLPSKLSQLAKQRAKQISYTDIIDKTQKTSTTKSKSLNANSKIGATATWLK